MVTTLVLLIAVLSLFLGGAISFIVFRRRKERTITKDSTVVLNQIERVCKLTHFEINLSEVIAHDDGKQPLLGFIPRNKRAIIILKSKMSVGHNLRNLKLEKDEVNKTITVKQCPALEVLSNEITEFRYFFTEDSMGNRFSNEDLNNHYSSARDHLKRIAEVEHMPHLEEMSRNQLAEMLEMIQADTGWKILYPLTATAEVENANNPLLR